jgi:PAS domain S-box-containing protein
MLVGFVLVTRPLTERTSGEATSGASERSASDAANCAICRLDIGGHVVSWNASAERITGYPAQEVIGRHVSLFYPDENAVATGDLEAAARDDGVADERWRLRKDGSRFWGNILIVALRNAREELVGFAKVTRDLTEQRRVDAERPRVSHASDKSTSAAALDGVRVVVVEDEADARELIQLVLERSGAEVLAAASAAEGLKAVEAFSPHVIVSDIGMPHEDGYSFMRRVRGLPQELGGGVAAVALTAYTREEDRLHAMRAGYNRHLAKPAHPDELVSTIRDLVKRESTRSYGE